MSASLQFQQDGGGRFIEDYAWRDRQRPTLRLVPAPTPDDQRLAEADKDQSHREGLIHYIRGTVRAEAGDELGAIDEFLLSIKAHPRADTFNNLGVCWARHGRPEEAFAAYRAAIEIDANHLLARENLSMSLYAADRFDEAIAAAEAAIRIAHETNRHTTIYGTLGTSQLRKGQISKGIDALRTAVGIRPDNVVARYNLGASLRRAGLITEALATLKVANELQPDDPGILHELGTALFQSDNFLDAIPVLDKAIKGYPTDEPDLAHAYFVFGQALALAARFSEAATAYEESIKRNPNSAVVLSSLGVVLLILKRSTEAESAYLKAIGLTFSRSDISTSYIASLYIDLAETLLQQGRFRDAIVIAQRTIALDPAPRADQYHDLGLLLCSHGLFAEGAPPLRSAVALDASHARWHRALARAAAHIGQPREAVEAFGKAYELDPSEAPVPEILKFLEMAVAAADARRPSLMQPGSHSNVDIEINRGHNTPGDSIGGASQNSADDTADDKRNAVARSDDRKADGGSVRAERPKWRPNLDTDLVGFVRSAYATEIAAGTLETGLIHREDPEFYKKLKNWQRTHALPEDIRIIDTRAEQKKINTEKLEQVGFLTIGRLLTRLRKEGNAVTQELIRLYDVQNGRRERAPKKAKPSRPSKTSRPRSPRRPASP